MANETFKLGKNVTKLWYKFQIDTFEIFPIVALHFCCTDPPGIPGILLTDTAIPPMGLGSTHPFRPPKLLIQDLALLEGLFDERMNVLKDHLNFRRLVNDHIDGNVSINQFVKFPQAVDPMERDILLYDLEIKIDDLFRITPYSGAG